MSLQTIGSASCCLQMTRSVFTSNWREYSTQLRRFHIELSSSQSFCARSDELFRSLIYLSETLSDPETGHSLEPEKASFVRHYKKPLWGWWLEHPRNFERFRVSMSGFSRIENLNSAEKGAFPLILDDAIQLKSLLSCIKVILGVRHLQVRSCAM